MSESKTVSLFRELQLLDAEALGCGDCTMLASWNISVSQRPKNCPHDDKFIFCPVTGLELAEWNKIKLQSQFKYIESRYEKKEEVEGWK